MPGIRLRCTTGDERGVALIVVMLVMMALSALGMSLALVTSTERQVTATYRDGMAVLYAADAALERVLPDLEATSSFIDGPPGPRRMPDGTLIDLHDLTSMVSEARSGGVPPWQLFGHGPLSIATAHSPGVYAIVWRAADPSDTPGRLSVMVHAYGPHGTRRIIEATLLRADRGAEMISWREIR
jgi:type IV pilus assembly PilX-like protein